ncbi:MAG: hypothetical protein ACW97Z_00820 [Candidatus Hodarchaeales archaeon]|jgi:hypothetical protein
MADDTVLFLIQIFNAVCCLIGFGLFFSAFRYAQKISKLLEETKIVKRWRIATMLVGGFSIGYLGNIVLIFFVDLSVLLIIEALVFLGGAIFVLLVFTLAYQTYELIYTIP